MSKRVPQRTHNAFPPPAVAFLIKCSRTLNAGITSRKQTKIKEITYSSGSGDGSGDVNLESGRRFEVEVQIPPQYRGLGSALAFSLCA